jgi:hypothetical protein
MLHIQDGEVAGPSRGTVIKYSGPIMTTKQEKPYPSKFRVLVRVIV